MFREKVNKQTYSGLNYCLLSSLKKFTFFIFLLSMHVNVTHAEGIKELANGTTSYPVTEIGQNGWGVSGASDDLKIYIYIEDPTTESVHLGFSTTGQTYNIYDPNGVLVYTNTTNGNASNVSEAIAGPTEVVGAGGYTSQVYTVSSGSPAGNYYIEFSGNVDIPFWDISVAKAGNTYTEIGRVWSMIWFFDMGGWTSDDSFEATLYAYSTEGFVSKVDYKGSNFRPYVFSIYYNDRGPGNSGNLEEDRKSVNGAEAGTASFPVFLNPPPEEIMPSASFGDLAGTPTITRTAETGSNKFSFNLESTQPGTFRILLNVENPSVTDVYDDVANSKDRVLVYDIEPQPGETPPYIRAMPWDGLDGDGNVLADGFPLNFTVSYADGRSHFPTYDAEYLADGLDVSQVRPSNGYNVQLFWDDSDIPDDPNNSTHSDFPNGTTGYNVELNGAVPPSHTWVNNNYGNVNTINTWWYCSVKQNNDQTINLPGLSGSAPSVQATDILFSEVGNSAMKINWTNGNGSKRVVFMKETGSGEPLPVDNTTYTANTAFGSGDQIGTTGWYCVYNGASSPEVVVTGLNDATEYRVMVLEYNNGEGTELYNTSTATGNPANQTTLTITQATNVSFTNVLANSFTVNWTNGTGSSRIAFIKLSSTAGDALPVNNTTYQASTVYGVGDQIGTSGWYCIYDGTGSTVDITNLATNTDYTVMVCEYFGTDGNQNYLTTTNATDPNNQTTLAQSPAHHIVFSNVTTNSMQIDWTNGDGTARQVFVKETTSTTDEPSPVDGTTYAANTVFGSGDQIGTTGWYCVYDGTPSTVSITGLSPSTDYRVMVCDYTGSYDFIEGSVPTNPLSQATYGTTPSVQAHDITFPNTGASQMEINWVNGNGTRRVVFASQTTTGQPSPVDGTNYNANSGFELGSQIGSSGWYCIYNGTGTSVVMNNILEATTYRFMVCEYNQDATGPLYNTSTATLNPNNNTSLTAGITVSEISQNTNESGQTATFTVVLNTQPTADVTIGLSSDDTGEGTLSSTNITFDVNNWSDPQEITVTGQDDAVFDGDITYTIITAAASSGDNNYNGINPDDVTVINEDNEAPTATLSVTTNGNENGPVSIEYTVTLGITNNTGSAITFDFDDLGTGTATSGSDYTAVDAAATISVADGSTTGTITIPVSDDSDFEGTETVIAQISNASVSGVNITTASATADISDDETVDAVLSVTTAGNETGPVGIEYTVTLSATNTTGSAITFDFDDLGTGTATSGSDYTAVDAAATISVAGGSTTGTITIPVSDDSDFEGTETVIAQISNASVSGVNITTASATADISDDETVDAVLSVTTAGNEAGPVSIEYTVTLSATNNTGSAITFDFDDLGTGTATSGSDYTAVDAAATISVADGSTTGTITIPVSDDSDFEGTETVIAQISNASVSGVNITTASATADISDDETVDAVLSVTTAGNETGPIGIEYTVTLSATNTTGTAITFDFDDLGTGTATSGSDYIAVDAAATISVADGSTTGTITIPVSDDSDFEGTETVIAQISNASVSGVNITTASATADISDDETVDAVLSVTTAGNETGPVGIEYTVTLSATNNTGSAITFDFDDLGTGTATSGSDYIAVDAAATISVADGSTSGTITVPVSDDSDLEGTETVIAQISNASVSGVNITTATATANISDDESINAVLSVTIAGNETGPVGIEYTVTLSATNTTGSAITFDFDDLGTGTATSGSDYTAVDAAATISVADGSTTGTITIPVSDDSDFEGTETVIAQISNVSVSGVSITTASATADISDDETVDAVLSVTTAGDENGPVSIEYTVTLSATNNTGSVITFDFDDLGTGTATSGSDYTAVDGAATISVADGSTTGTITVPVSDDSDLEGTETVIAQISNASVSGVNITTASATADINDDELPPNSSPIVKNDTANIFEGKTAKGNLLSNDTDPDGDDLVINKTPVSGPSNGNVVINPDGTYEYTPNDGFTGTDSLVYEVCDNGTPSKCSTGTVIITVTDNDKDDDGIPNDVEGTDDPDGDGIPSDEDTDSDGDGIPDSDEGTTDTDGDGIPDYKDTDSDGDGIPDSDEGTTDTDGDGIPDYKDTDSDGDGIPDSDEGTTDTDGDGIPDYKDTDSDGDGIPDSDEGTTDTDGDGIPDYKDTDSDGDGIPDSDEGTTDTDGDGIPDYKDTDSDGDGIPDSDEGTTDTDGDGTPDYRDTDSDGDGVPDSDEGSIDTDGDGIPDYIDTDSDNDGISDGSESEADCDNDNIPDRIDPDNCDEEEIFVPQGFSPNGDGSNDYFVIEELEQYSHVSIIIFNRWGNKIFEQDNYKNDWDGNSNVDLSIGKELPVGTYFYQVIIHDNNKTLTGYVYLNR